MARAIQKFPMHISSCIGKRNNTNISSMFYNASLPNLALTADVAHKGLVVQAEAKKFNYAHNSSEPL